MQSPSSETQSKQIVNPRQTRESALSNELRLGQTPLLRKRRWIIGLSLLGTAMGQIVSLYQTGIVKHLPDPPIPGLNSDKVDASDYGYKRLRTPDAFLMTISYGITAALAAAEGERRDRTTPWLSLAMVAKIAADLGFALQLTREEWQENSALCTYCQVATICSAASLILCWPEVSAAVQQLQGKTIDAAA